MKKVMLNVIAKTAQKAVKEASGSKSWFYYFEPEMPARLKAKKMSQ